MGSEYLKSSKIIAVLAAIISLIVLINEDIGIKIIGIIIFAGVAFLASFLGTRVSQKMIQVGDKISAGYKRIIYYAGLLAGILICSFIFWRVLELLSDSESSDGTLASSLSQGIFILLLGCFFFIFLIIPYIQSLIVLILRKNHKDDNNSVLR